MINNSNKNKRVYNNFKVISKKIKKSIQILQQLVKEITKNKEKKHLETNGHIGSILTMNLSSN